MTDQVRLQFNLPGITFHNGFKRGKTINLTLLKEQNPTILSILLTLR